MDKKPKHLKKNRSTQVILSFTLIICLISLGVGFWWNYGQFLDLNILNTTTSFVPAAARGVGHPTSKDTMVLAKVISGEARGESYIGQVAVGAVVINRAKNPNFPNSVYGVVFEPGAFDAVKDGQYYDAPTASSLNAAKDALAGWDPSDGSIYYWNPVTATSKWIWSRPIIARIGKHVFAK